MSNRPFHFLHASDFHLDQPLGGLVDVPEHLRDDFIDAPFKAAARIFDAAVRDRVDFLLLSGDILHPPTASPRAYEFLLNYFQRLCEHKIDIYWAHGPLEGSDPWPAQLGLPPNVHVFPLAKVQAFEVHRDDRVLATIVGKSNPRGERVNAEEFRGKQDGFFRIAVTYGEIDERSLADQRVDYWALGGKHNPRTLSSAPVARYCGTPQGRRPSEPGPHGCLMVEVNSMEARATMMEMDWLQYAREQIDIDEATTRAELESLMRERSHLLLRTGTDDHILVSWRIVGDGPLSHDLRYGRLAEEIMGTLRQEFGKGERAVWSVELESLPRTIPAELYEEDTILGDFLRAVHEFETKDDSVLDVRQYLPDTDVARSLAERIGIGRDQQRPEILQRVATLGIDLLHGDPNG